MIQPRVAFVTTGLFRGGAEAMLYKLIAASPELATRTLVLSLGDHGPFADDLRALGVPVASLGFHPTRPSPSAVLRLRAEIKRFRPDVIQGWMYHGNMAALLAARFTDRPVPVLWSIRQSLGDSADEKPVTRWMIRAGARLSSLPRHIIYNSRRGADQHEAVGYRADRRLFIPNGFDTTLFRADRTARVRLGSRFGFSDSTIVIGHVARYHPMKDHVSLLRAAAQLLEEGVDVAFVLIGRDVRRDHPVLGQEIGRLGLANSPRIQLIPELPPADIAAMTQGFDIACSTSAWGDAFPNVLGEAMACAVPCVTTAVGDAAFMVDDTGIVVPPAQAGALAEAFRTLALAAPDHRRALGVRAQQRVHEQFDIRRVAERYQEVFRETASV